MGDVSLCVSFCDTAGVQSRAGDLVDMLGRTCLEAGFPACERVYAGSYFCENYFLALDEGFHDAVGEVAARHDMGATLVVPIFGQAMLYQGIERLDYLLERFGTVYDEIVVNDVATYADLSPRTQARLGIGRLFMKTQRDARYAEVFGAPSRPELSPEALACVQLRPGARPLVEVDPASAVVDVSRIFEQAPDAEVALHLPYAYATTGRLCSSASIDAPDSEKFRIGRPCACECLRMSQGSRVENGVRYLKRGRTHFYANSACRIAGVDSWRIVYSAMAASAAWRL
ncbi:MAG: hypothetical protein IJ087_20255 [Eggerthellaceae bacterium]|nr:hypothetical protein [Eggerthellaceae bacterium]